MKATNGGRIRVVVIDDSATARELLVGLFRQTQDLDVVGVGNSGLDAIRLVQQLSPDILAMDVRMPKMDGLEATRQIMRSKPLPIVLVTASLMHADNNLTFEALKAGALSVVKKPGLSDPVTSDGLLQAIRLMAKVPVVHHWGRGEKSVPSVRRTMSQVTGLNGSELYKNVQMVGIASSTGGPAALQEVLAPLPVDYPLPVLIVQHVTNGFAAGLSDWLDGQVALQVRLAGHGERPQPGLALIAPDDYHMQVNRQGVIELVKGEPYKGLRPSANYLFQSLGKYFGSKAAGIILTGMGDDGVNGLVELHEAGGFTIAQNEESCVVYGMPREAVQRGAVEKVLPPAQIADLLCRLGLARQKGGQVG